MSHPEVENRNQWNLKSVHLLDRDGNPLVAYLVVNVQGIESTGLVGSMECPEEIWSGASTSDTEHASLIYEPQIAYIKPTTDVVLIGSAHPQARNQTHVDVRVRVGGEIDKTVRVFGDRTWTRYMGLIDKSPPNPIEQPIPLVYERAFGGWDSPEPDPYRSKFEPRNPVGVGYPQTQWQEGLPLPNLEDPNYPLMVYGDKPPPAGFGFVSPHWQPRAKLAGTYDKQWEETRAPLLPTDFDERFFNAASSGMITSKYLAGDEPVCIEGATPGGRLDFRLPGLPPPTIRVQLKNGEEHRLQTHLDTVIMNTDEMILVQIWRNHLVLRNGPHDVDEVEIR